MRLIQTNKRSAILVVICAIARAEAILILADVSAKKTWNSTMYLHGIDRYHIINDALYKRPSIAVAIGGLL